MDNLENKIEEEALRMAKNHIQQYPPYYGQIPIELMRDPNIRPQAKCLYGLMHSYSSTKELNRYPPVEIAVRTMMDYMGYYIGWIWRSIIWNGWRYVCKNI